MDTFLLGEECPGYDKAKASVTGKDSPNIPPILPHHMINDIYIYKSIFSSYQYVYYMYLHALQHHLECFLRLGSKSG